MRNIRLWQRQGQNKFHDYQITEPHNDLKGFQFFSVFYLMLQTLCHPCPPPGLPSPTSARSSSAEGAAISGQCQRALNNESKSNPPELSPRGCVSARVLETKPIWHLSSIEMITACIYSPLHLISSGPSVVLQKMCVLMGPCM